MSITGLSKDQAFNIANQGGAIVAPESSKKEVKKGPIVKPEELEQKTEKMAEATKEVSKKLKVVEGTEVTEVRKPEDIAVGKGGERVKLNPIPKIPVGGK